MTFLWPFMLFTLLLVPLFVVFYLRAQRKRRILSAGFQQMYGGKPAAKGGPGLRRHLPAALFLTGLAILLVGLARPQAQVTLPRIEGTVMLVFDVSGSMAAEDVQPSRLEAAKESARAFVLSQPQTVRIGIVSFSRSGFAIQRPTNDTQRLLTAIKRLEPQSGTSLGQGIAVALNALALDAGLVAVAPTPTLDFNRPRGSQPQPQPTQPVPLPDSSLLASLPEGLYPPAVIVVLSDGENNQSIDPVEVAEAAAERGVRIDALGFGTTEGYVLEVDGFKVHSALDEDTLQQITEAAGGEYYYVQNETDPQTIYANLTPKLVVKLDRLEITSIFTGASIFFFLLGGVLSMFWFNRLP